MMFKLLPLFCQPLLIYLQRNELPSVKRFSTFACTGQIFWASQVEPLLQNCIDLVVEEAVYHKSCYCKFTLYKSLGNSENKVVGRPENKDMLAIFTKLCEWLESEAELYTLSELHQKMKDLSGGKEVYTVKRLKQKLQEHYKEFMFFAEVQGRANVVCFCNMVDFLINETWHAQRKESIAEESLRIVTTAAKIIQAEIRDSKYNMEYYPANEDVKNVERGKEWLPESLTAFLQVLVPSVTKQVSIGQCLLKAARPRSVIPPLLFGLGVEMDHVFGSKWLINELSRLGFSISYDEVTKYKQSVVKNETIEDLQPECFTGSITQWVADNVDHNIATLDGRGTFHGMGIISASTHTTSTVTRRHEQLVRRENLVKSKALVLNKGVPISQYILSQKPALSSLKITLIQALQFPYTLPSSINLDLIWHAGGLFRSMLGSRPNWSGFMQHVSTGSHPGTADVLFLPIIDLKSSDENCIYSTLKFIQSQANRLNIETQCITFDQPLWIKAVEIIKAKSLNIFCTLGGFHIMMSFLGSIRFAMNGSGLICLMY